MPSGNPATDLIFLFILDAAVGRSNKASGRQLLIQKPLKNLK
jgi:hypothetical protein